MYGSSLLERWWLLRLKTAVVYLPSLHRLSTSCHFLHQVACSQRLMDTTCRLKRFFFHGAQRHTGLFRLLCNTISNVGANWGFLAETLKTKAEDFLVRPACDCRCRSRLCIKCVSRVLQHGVKCDIKCSKRKEWEACAGQDKYHTGPYINIPVPIIFLVGVAITQCVVRNIKGSLKVACQTRHSSRDGQACV